MRELVDRYIDAYNRKDVEAMLATMHPALVFENHTAGVLGVRAPGLAALRQLAGLASCSRRAGRPSPIGGSTAIPLLHRSCSKGRLRSICATAHARGWRFLGWVAANFASAMADSISSLITATDRSTVDVSWRGRAR